LIDWLIGWLAGLLLLLLLLLRGNHELDQLSRNVFHTAALYGSTKFIETVAAIIKAKQWKASTIESSEDKKNAAVCDMNYNNTDPHSLSLSLSLIVSHCVS
jgi:ankyrin repeat protein